MLAELKTKKNKASVSGFLNKVKDEQKRNDSFVIAGMMQKATKEKPQMWGSSIVGFGATHLKYASGRELEWLKIGFSPRKQNLTIYLCCDGFKKQKKFLKKLGKYKTGKGCLYIKRLSDIDIKVLKKIIESAL